MKTELTEILKKHTKEEWRTLPSGGRELIVITDYDGAFKEYFDQQTEQLKKEVKLHFTAYCKLDEQFTKLQSQLSEKDKELSELKAKHNYELPLFNVGDLITLNTGYTCDKGEFLRYEGNLVVWKGILGGIYKSPIDKYNITKI